MNRSNKKRALFIVTRKFWPTNSGHEVVLYNYCKCLNEDFNYDIYIYCFSNSDIINNKPSFIKDIRIAKPINFISRIKNIIFNAFIKNNMPLQMALYQDEYYFTDICDYYMQIQASVVYFDMLRLSEYRKSIPVNTKSILMMDDLLSKRYFRQISNKNAEGNILGYYSKNLPNCISKFFNCNLLKNIILKFEAKRMAEYEKKYCSYFDYITLVSPIEVKNLKQTTARDNIVCVPMVVDCGKLSGSTNINSNELVFVGNFFYAPNVDSLDYIVNKIFPHLKNKTKLNVIGKYPEELKSKYANKTFIKFYGRVEDLKSIVQNSCIFIAPIAYGTGIKTKIIEAMAMGMPVITNEVGAEGIYAKRDIAFIVRNNAVELASAVDKLIENKSLCLEMGKQAATYANENHNWNNMRKAFVKISM